MTNLKPAPHDIALIDFEASSLDECISYPIQVGVSFADTAEDIDTLIRPHIDPNAPKDKQQISSRTPMLNAVSLGLRSDAPMTAMRMTLPVRLRNGTSTEVARERAACRYKASNECA